MSVSRQKLGEVGEVRSGACSPGSAWAKRDAEVFIW